MFNCNPTISLSHLFPFVFDGVITLCFLVQVDFWFVRQFLIEDYISSRGLFGITRVLRFGSLFAMCSSWALACSFAIKPRRSLILLLMGSCGGRIISINFLITSPSSDIQYRRDYTTLVRGVVSHNAGGDKRSVLRFTSPGKHVRKNAHPGQQ